MVKNAEVRENMKRDLKQLLHELDLTTFKKFLDSEQLKQNVSN